MTEPGRLLLGLLIGALAGGVALAGDQPQWGQWHSRNMVSGETGLPDTFDPKTSKNIKWSASLGTESYATPVVSGGKVLIGANNGRPRDPRHHGNRGVLLCLDEATGELCWQLVVPRFQGVPYLDWPRSGICSPPTVEGNRVYIVSNRAEVLCLDLKGQADGNDGPFRDEGRYMVPSGSDPLEVTDIDADIIWMFDMPSEVSVHPHDAAHTSILVHRQYLYLNTGNGVDRKHSRIPEPDAPSLIVLDKRTGKLVARDGERIGPRIFHCTWSSPALGVVKGRNLIFFCGGDGVCYAFQALEPTAGNLDSVRNLERVWRFDCDPKAPKKNVHDFVGNRRESPSNVKSTPVYHDNRVYVTVGGDIWWGKNLAWLQCIDATKSGDITETGLLWSYPLERHCCSTPAVDNGLVFVGDCGRTIHCVDARTGERCWTHETKGVIWASTLVADGKVFVGSRAREFVILAASRKKKVLATIELENPVSATPVAANGVLYVATQKNLYAVSLAASGE